MKKFMKTIAAGLSAIIGMTFMSVTASAEMTAEYLLDENNIVWEDENGIRCYENGEMVNVGNREYMLYVVPANGVTTEDLGVKITDLLSSTRSHISFLPDDAIEISAGDSEELQALCDKAQNWYDEGLINYAYASDLITYGCVSSAELIITLKEADKDYDPTEEYEWLEDANVKHNDAYNEYTILGYDNTKLPEITEQISADERVETCKRLDINCAVLHVTWNELLSLKRSMLGDITGDCEVNLYDAIEICRYIMENRALTDEKLAIADYNADGEVNLYDVIDIAKTLM